MLKVISESSFSLRFGTSVTRTSEFPVLIPLPGGEVLLLPRVLSLTFGVTS